MSDVVIHLYCRQSNGTIEDAQHTFDLSDFGGFLPAVGDKILDPGVPASLERHVPENRRLWTVVDRVFNPRDTKDFVAQLRYETSCSVGRRPSGVYLSTAVGSSRESRARSSSRDSPVCCDKVANTSGPIACSSWGGATSLLGPVPTQDSAMSPWPFWLKRSTNSLSPLPSSPPTPAPPKLPSSPPKPLCC